MPPRVIPKKGPGRTKYQELKRRERHMEHEQIFRDILDPSELPPPKEKTVKRLVPLPKRLKNMPGVTSKTRMIKRVPGMDISLKPTRRK